eukprot:8430623-Alexandrium_andersonii.AAC.1
MVDKKRRAARVGELGRFQMEEAIRASEGRLVPPTASSPVAGAISPPPASTSTSPGTTSPRTTQLLKE